MLNSGHIKNKDDNFAGLTTNVVKPPKPNIMFPSVSKVLILFDHTFSWTNSKPFFYLLRVETKGKITFKN